MKSLKAGLLIVFYLAIQGCSRSILLKGDEPIFQSASIQNGQIVLKGQWMDTVNSVSPTSSNLNGYQIQVVSKTENKLVLGLKQASDTPLHLTSGQNLGLLLIANHRKIPLTLNLRSVPSGAVSAFRGASCPTGWSDYTPAQGRFVKGYDPTHPVDVVGTLSSGENPTVSGTLNLFSFDGNLGVFDPGSGAKLTSSSNGPPSGAIYTVDSGPASVTFTDSNSASRPPYVILRYCEKD